MAKTIGDYVKIGGRTWNVKVKEISESFNILDTENAGRVINKGAMTLDRIGTFFGHKVTFFRDKASISEYDELFMYLATPRNTGVTVDLVHGQGTLQYNAYVASGERKIKKINVDSGLVEWGEFSVTFTPMEAQVTP